MIENPIPTRRAWLVWQRPLDGAGFRKRHPVAEIAQNGDRMSFRYLDKEHLAAAHDEGFMDYPGLPIGGEHLGEVASKVLPRRLPPRNRGDFGDLLERFGFPADKSDSHSDLTLLAYTGGRLTGDSFSICETFDGFEAPFTYVFDLAGYRHHHPFCEEGDTLIFEREPDNERDPDAVRVARTDGDTVGYVNRLQAPRVGRWLDEGEISASVLRVNGRIEYPRLLARAEIHSTAKSLAA